MDDRDDQHGKEEVDKVDELTEDMFVDISGGVRSMLDPDG
jgi:hypothetical protein